MLAIVSNYSFSPPAFQALLQTSAVQLRNRTTGVAMSLPKKRVVKSRLSPSRNKSRHSFRPVGQAGRANSSGIEPDGPWAGRLTFVEDFTLEHSLHRLYLTSIEIAGIF